MIQTVPLPSATLRSRVAEQVGWTAQAQWSALFGGRTNAAWQVTDGSQSLVLKLYRASNDNPLFPNDPRAEALMLTHLNGLGLAPELISSFESPEGDCTLYHAIPGNAWTKGPEAVAKMMQRLHAQPVPSALRSVPNGAAQILANADEILSRCKESSGLMGLRPDVDLGPAARTVLLHCDIVPGNLIENETGLHLIDWQCPGVGDPCEDIAIFLSPAMQRLYRGHALSAAETRLFLNAYPTEANRYRVLAPVYHFRMAAYCQWQVENGVPDYAEGLEAEVSAMRAILAGYQA